MNQTNTLVESRDHTANAIIHATDTKHDALSGFLIGVVLGIFVLAIIMSGR